MEEKREKNEDNVIVTFYVYASEEGSCQNSYILFFFSYHFPVGLSTCCFVLDFVLLFAVNLAIVTSSELMQCAVMSILCTQHL